VDVSSVEGALESPDAVKLSLAAAMQLGFSPARFHRGARMTCINLLLTYASGCSANCSYCGLARDRQVAGDRSFIRVPWPVRSTDEVLGRIAESRVVKRTCLSMITHSRSVADSIALTKRIAERTRRPVSVLLSPTIVERAHLEALRAAGADRIGIAIDAPTEDLFDRHRGRAARGPHRWGRYWQVFGEGIEVFGKGMVGSHFIVGLGESERDMVTAFQRVRDLGGVNHLFSFYPEPGTALADHEAPPMAVYRRMQIACELIDSGRSHAGQFRFDGAGRIVDFGVAAETLEKVIASGQPFRTRGCQGADGEVACNRPFANSRPGDGLRNYPFPPNAEDMRRIRAQIEGRR
jgi:biotin synthase-related radical SAM superfamily protein